jgi:Anti-sigma-K factor rskA
MALSADQRAMLELLLQRGQSYEDLSSLLDLPEAEVRERARAALTELGGEDPDRNVGITDYLLGQADPIGRADAARHLKEDPEDHALASKLAASLQLLAPGAELPKLPPEPSGGRFLRRTPAGAQTAEAAEPAAAGQPGRARSWLAELTSSQTRLMVGGGSAAVILIVVVLALTGAFGGDGDDGSAATTADTTTGTGDEAIQTVRLKPTEGGDAKGSATFGIASSDQAYVDLDVSNLESAPQGKIYVLWLMISDSQAYPLQPFQPEQNGTFSDRAPIDASVSQLAARTQAVNVSLTEQKPLFKAVSDAVNQGSPLLPYQGDTILSGDVATK